ncbi:MAG: aspartate aminotransferase family protein [Planctomycetota bacterium]|jgi:acetylornithine/succinyldiaminopimelate/putrescine aminotransferase
MSTQELDEKYILQTFKKRPVTINRGEDVWVFDDADNKYLDLYGGHCVAGVGHSHPKLVEAISDQAKRLMFYSNAVYNDIRSEAAQTLIDNAYPNSACAFFCNSGTEANEVAIKIARRATGRKKIIAMDQGFHGRTIGALSVTGKENLRTDFPENLAEHTEFVPHGDFESLEEALSEDVAAIIVEPITSVGGVRTSSHKYFDGLRELCLGNGTALIFDEVQTGFGRTGKMFAGMHWDVEPDIMTCAKAMGGGFPMGGVILSEAISGAPAPGEHGSTFGGGMLAMAAMKANIEVINEENLADNAVVMERAVRDALGSVPDVVSVLGKGLLLGIELKCPAAPVVEGLMAEKIIVGGCDRENMVRLMPPLTLKQEHVDQFAEALNKVLDSVSASAK